MPCCIFAAAPNLCPYLPPLRGRARESVSSMVWLFAILGGSKGRAEALQVTAAAEFLSAGR